MGKLTSNQRVTLERLAGMTQPWNPSGRSTQMLLAALGRQGLAQKRHGYPAGWEASDAGKAAVASCGDWRPMSDAPRDGTIFRAEIRGYGDCHLIAWTEGIGVDDDDQPCGAWVHHGPGEPPPCWSDGACWDSNADGSMSAPPVRWMQDASLLGIELPARGESDHG